MLVLNCLLNTVTSYDPSIYNVTRLNTKYINTAPSFIFIQSTPRTRQIYSIIFESSLNGRFVEDMS